MKRIANDWLGIQLGDLAYPARLGIYAAISLVSYQLLYVGVQRRGAAWVGAENGPVELTQVVLAIGGAVALFYAAARCPVGRFGLTASACLLGYAAARESDAFLEAVFFEDAYKYLVGLPLLAVMTAVLWRDGRRAVPESLWLLRQPQATLFGMAGIFLCTFCQLLDRPGTWQSLAGAGSPEGLRLMIEESSELFAYWLLAFSSVEGALMARRVAGAEEEVAGGLREATEPSSDAERSEPRRHRAA